LRTFGRIWRANQNFIAPARRVENEGKTAGEMRKTLR